MTRRKGRRSSLEPGSQRGALLRRREVLAGGVALAGAGAVPVASALVDGEPSATGVISHIDGSRLLTITSRDGKGITVRVDVDAAINRNGAATLDDLVVGDEISADGSWAEDAFHASSVELLYRLVDGAILERGHDVVSTDGGTVRLTSKTESEGGSALSQRLTAAPLESLGAGDHVVVLGHRDPSEATDLVAVKVGTVATDE
jgi:hypothetical protein